jgi:NitT/TauT family transport system substrate-binding protein
MKKFSQLSRWQSLAALCCALFTQLQPREIRAAELPPVRIAHGAFSEKVVALWLGTEQGLFRKHGVNVEVINIRSGPQTMAALVSGDIQVAYTIPGSVVSAATSGLDVAFFAGLVNKADGDFIAGSNIRNPEDLKGKRIGVQSIGGGVWSMAMLAIEHLGLEPQRDKMTVLVVGDSPVLAQSLEQASIEATYLNYTHSRALKEKGFPVLLDLGKAPIPYQGLAAATRRSYLKQNPLIIDSLMRGFVETVAFIQRPANKETVIKSLVKNLRLKSAQDAEIGYAALQWLYNLDIKPTIAGIQNMARFLALTNPKVKSVKIEDVVDEAPWQRLEKSPFYRELLSTSKK